MASIRPVDPPRAVAISLCRVASIALIVACGASLAPADGRIDDTAPPTGLPVTDPTILPSQASFRVPVDDAIRIGDREYTGTSEDWVEFRSVLAAPEHPIGSEDLTLVRQWVGHSDCPTCAPGEAKTQRIAFDDLNPGETYQFTVYPAFYTDEASTFSARFEGGEVTLGTSLEFGKVRGYLQRDTYWLIEFVPDSPSGVLVMGNDLTVGTTYYYVDSYQFSPKGVGFEELTPAGLSAQAADLDTVNGGDWFKDQLYDAVGGQYNRVEGYVMDSYVRLYELTGDTHWLDKLVDHGDAALAQRDHLNDRPDYRGVLAPVWQQHHNQIPYVGFTGTMFAPMARFSYIVLRDPALDAYEDTALDYLDAFAEAVAYHDPDWQLRGTYVLPADIPAGVPEQPVTPFDGAQMASAFLDASRARDVLGQTATAIQYLDRVTRYAGFFQARLEVRFEGADEYYVWAVNEDNPRLDTFGRAGPSVRFVHDCALEGIIFGEDDVRRMAVGFDRLIGPNADVAATLMDGTVDPGVGRFDDGTFGWHFAAPFLLDLSDRAAGNLRHEGLPFVDFVAWTYATTVHDI